MPCFSLEFRLCGKKPREREIYNRERERESERERDRRRVMISEAYLRFRKGHSML
jgi:hypothetical protein